MGGREKVGSSLTHEDDTGATVAKEGLKDAGDNETQAAEEIVRPSGF
jgi:hypothetical protein